MANIGGNIFGVLQACTAAKNAIGEAIKTWEDKIELCGWLGLQAGTSNYSAFNAKVEESTHVFLCDYSEAAYKLSSSDARMIIKGFVYDVLLIDNPDEMNEQLEIYLKRVGAWNG